MKLFVIGERSPNPEDWSKWSEYAIVVAGSVEEAEKLAGWGPATEIPMDRPLVLCKMPEPLMGDDL